MSVYAHIRAAVSAAAVLAATSLMSPASAAADGLDDIAPRDTSGLSITEYRLSFNNGAGIFGPLFTPDVTIPAAVAYLLFLVFIVAVWIGFTTLNILPRTDWLSPLVRTIQTISDQLYAQMGVPFISTVITGMLMATTALYALRNRGNKAWHHIAVTLVCVVIGAAIAFPVAEAAKLLGFGAHAAVSSGQAITGGASAGSAHNPTGVLINEWVRKPVQRWTFGGQDLDSLGCGGAWTAAISAHKPDKIKDVPLSCPGGSLGIKMHDAAMNPQDSLVDSGVTTLFGVLLAYLLVRVVLKLTGVSVAALIHAAMIKLGLIGAATEGGQRFLVRNAVDAPMAAMLFFAGLLAVYVGADIAKIIAQVVPSSMYGMLLTIVLIAAANIGVRRASQSWSRVRGRAANAAVSGAGSGTGAGSALIRPQIPGGRMLALGAATRYAMRKGRSARRTGRRGMAAVAPEIAAPTEMVSKIRAAAKRASRHASGAATRSASSAHRVGGGGSASGGIPTVSVAAGESGNVGAGAVGMGPAHYARMAASQYRAHRGGLSAGRRASPPRVAGRGGSQSAMAAVGAPGGRGAYGYAHDAGSAGGRQGPMPASTARTADSVVRAVGRPSGGSGAVRRGGGTADGARQVARGYFRSRDNKR
jgi:hypothetical protein